MRIRVEKTEEGSSDEVARIDLGGLVGWHVVSPKTVVMPVEPPARVAVAGKEQRLRARYSTLGDFMENPGVFIRARHDV